MKVHDKDVTREMLERIENYNQAKNDPTARTGGQGRTASPDFVAPEPKKSERFSQLDKEVEDCTVSYGTGDSSSGRQGCGTIDIHVNDNIEEDADA